MKKESRARLDDAFSAYRSGRLRDYLAPLNQLDLVALLSQIARARQKRRQPRKELRRG